MGEKRDCIEASYPKATERTWSYSKNIKIAEDALFKIIRNYTREAGEEFRERDS